MKTKTILACEIKKGMFLAIGNGIFGQVTEVQSGQDSYIKVFCDILFFPVLIIRADKVDVIEAS